MVVCGGGVWCVVCGVWCVVVMVVVCGGDGGGVWCVVCGGDGSVWWCVEEVVVMVMVVCDCRLGWYETQPNQF